MTSDLNVILSGVVGSTAYGLAGPDSDVDRLGFFAAPTADFHGLTRPDESRVSYKPDVTYHELGKACGLMLGGNPTVSELLWLEKHEVVTTYGAQLIAMRGSFVSAKRVRDAYLGYATGQFKRLSERGDGSFSADTRKRTAKHARHLLRLLDQGCELYSTGHLTVRLADPGKYHQFGADVASGNLQVATDALARAEQFFDSTSTPLPAEPDTAAVDAWLRSTRHSLWVEDMQSFGRSRG